jgi:2-iminobutanoate/2-iminopropanoate deaminase
VAVKRIFCSLALGALLATPLTTGALAADRRTIMPPEFAPAAGTAAPLFSPGILVDGTLYVAGQIGQDLKTKQVPEDFEAEVRTCLDRIGIILKAAGMSFQDTVSVNVYITDMDLFARMNAVYGTYFKEPRPARTTVGVSKLALPNARIEINLTARK